MYNEYQKLLQLLYDKYKKSQKNHMKAEPDICKPLNKYQ